MRTHLMLSLALVGTLFGCAADRAYREPVGSICFEKEGGCNSRSMIRSANDYTLAFVEIDEQGIFWDRKQMQELLDHVESKKDQYIIVYVHGWHHSAVDGDSNIEGFQRRLKFTKERYPNKEVTGVYVGWRGDSIDVNGLNVLTFWDRKNVSEEIGKHALLELVLRLENVKKQREDRNVLMLVGHSFGGSALYNAVHQTLLQRLIQAEGAEVRGVGDIVVLVNPAIESTSFAPLYDASQVHAASKGFQAGQPVRLLAVASSADSAAKVAFPLGRGFSTALEKHRTYTPPLHRKRGTKVEIDQAAMDVQAIGHFYGHVTHKLDANKSAGANYSCPYSPGWRKKAVDRKIASDASESVNLFGEGWDTGHHGRGSKVPPLLNDPSEMQVRHLVGKSHAYSPYWVVATDETVFPGHNDINQKHFWCFIDVVIQEGAGSFAPPLSTPNVVPEK